MYQGTLTGLDALKELEINTERIGLILENGALDGLDQLEYLGLKGIREISADELAGLSRIRHINIRWKRPSSGPRTRCPRDLQGPDSWTADGWRT